LFETEDQVFFPFGTASFDPEIVPSPATLGCCKKGGIQGSGIVLRGFERGF